jgi:hypothetical protein
MRERDERTSKYADPMLQHAKTAETAMRSELAQLRASSAAAIVDAERARQVSPRRACCEFVFSVSVLFTLSLFESVSTNDDRMR